MIVTEELPTLARNVKSLREAQGLSQQELAVAAGLSVAVVSLIEQGGRENPKLDTLVKLARVLNVTIDALISPKGKRKGK
jgi:transcriptional regulator with XRE-family HTH domain